MKKSLLALLAAAALISCDEENTIYYKLSNQTQDTLRVVFTYKDNYMDNQPGDTLVIIPPTGKNTIFEVTQWGPSIYKPDGATMTFFYNMDIDNGNANDTLLIDVYKSSNWHYRETSSHTADYLLELKDGHFGQ